MTLILNNKTYDLEKIRLYDLQSGVCPICKRDLDPEITKNHLDHDHVLDGINAGKIRGLLCSMCNRIDGRYGINFIRSGLSNKGIDFADHLISLGNYLKQDFSNNNIHPSYIKDLKKKFKRLDKSGMILELEIHNLSYDKSDTKEKLIKIYNKNILNIIKNKI